MHINDSNFYAKLEQLPDFVVQPCCTSCPSVTKTDQSNSQPSDAPEDTILEPDGSMRSQPDVTTVHNKPKFTGDAGVSAVLKASKTGHQRFIADTGSGMHLVSNMKLKEKGLTKH